MLNKTKFLNYLLFILLISFAFPVFSQSISNLPKVIPSYSEDFRRYKSYPSMCFNDVFYGQQGELWLKTCGGALQIHLPLFQFDGYEFRSLQHLFSELGSAFRIDKVVDGQKMLGHTIDKKNRLERIFLLNLYNKEIQFFDIPEKGEIVRLHVDKDNKNIHVLQNVKGFLHTYEIVDEKVNFRHKIKQDYFSFEKFHVEFFDGKTIWMKTNMAHELIHRIDIQNNHIHKFRPSDFYLDKNNKYFKTRGKKSVSRFQVFGDKVFAQITVAENRRQILQLDFDKDEFFPITGIPNDLKKSFISQDKKGNLIYVFETKDEKLQAILEDPNGDQFNYSTFFNSIEDFQIKNITGLDFKKELLICGAQGIQIHKVKSQESFQNYLEESIRAMVELKDNKVFITTQNQDRFILNLNNKQIQKVDLGDCKVNHQKVISDKEGGFWGFNNANLIRYNSAINSCKTYPIPMEEKKGIRSFDFLNPHQIIFTINQKIGFYDLDQGKTSFLKIDDKPFEFTGFPHNIMVAKNGLAWLVTSDVLYKINVETNHVEVIGKNAPFTDSHFLCIEEDASGKLWLGTPNNGVYIYDPITKALQTISSKNGLGNNTVVSITTDNEGRKWLGTYNGISLVTSKGKLITNFYEEDGVVNRESNRYAFLKTSKGKILIGTIRGLTIIDPDKVNERLGESKNLNIYLTKLEYFDVKNKKDTVQSINLNDVNTITLPAEQRDLDLYFATSNYVRPSENKYAYKFEGTDQDWTEIGNQPQLNFKNLSPGKHQLLIKGGDGFGSWTENPIQLNIIAKEFFYKQSWFYFLLTALGIAVAFLWISRLQSAVQKATKTIRVDKEIIERQAKELKELDKAKSQFFTNISHEFRTPLTIISGMIDQINTKPEIWLEKGTKTIKQNTLNLLNLINQILDLRKLESKSLTLNLVKGDIVKYLHYLTNSFESFAENKGLKLHFITSTSSIIMDYDPDKILRVISNLLSNAIKYNKEEGNIYFQVNQIEEKGKKYLKLHVQDTGKGIPNEKLENVFDRFFQINEPGKKKVVGSGIGLSLTYQLIHLMKGDINVKSELNVGTTFLIKIPITQNANVNDSIYNKTITNNKHEDVIHKTTPDSYEPKSHLVAKEENSDLPHLLIVEDNPQIIQILEACLEDEYQLRIAKNGKEGIEFAINHVPDIIISDVMMPIKDGFKLCDTLKQDERTSHIPIILLTAKSDIDSKISGLERGADAYLSKPFEQKELLTRIRKLLELRLKLQERYRSLDVTTNEEKPISIEDIFIQKVRKVIEENISDESFGIINLCRAIALSRSQLHNKIKALTGLSTSIFIRSIRLKKAKHLLENSDLNVSEVAYEVGFKNSNYFSTLYLEEYGERPSQTRQSAN